MPLRSFLSWGSFALGGIVEREQDKSSRREGRERLSHILVDIFSGSRGVTTYGGFVDRLDSHGMAVILVLFSIPSALPVPAAGYSTLLSLPLLMIGIRVLLGFDSLWLPRRIRAREFDGAKFQKLEKAALRMVSFIERFSKPRWIWFVRSKGTRCFLGILICALALSMALPIPGTNTLPAGGIFLIGFALLEDDGLLLGGGILYSLVALCLSVFIIVFGYEVVKAVLLNFFG